jgi:hypothetical protein
MVSTQDHPRQRNKVAYVRQFISSLRQLDSSYPVNNSDPIFDNSQGMTLSVMVSTWLTNLVELKTLSKISQR